MASTRSLARTLKLFTGIGITAIEELDGDYSGNGNGKGKTKPPARKSNPQKLPTSQTYGNSSTVGRNGQAPSMSDSQKRAIYAISKRQGIVESQIIQMCNEIFNLSFNYISIPSFLLRKPITYYTY